MSHDAPGSHDPSCWVWRLTNYSKQTDTGKAVSWVRCSVEGQAGVEVSLTIDPDSQRGAGDGPVTLTARTGSRPDYGPTFCELGPVKAGHYTLTVASLDVLVPVWLDGTAWASVTFFPAGAETRPAHVLLLGAMMSVPGNFLALTRYVARFGAVVTFDPEQAARAAHVILVGSTQLLSQAVEQRIRAAGARVERVQGDIEAQLDRAVASGTPYLFP